MAIACSIRNNKELSLSRVFICSFRTSAKNATGTSFNDAFRLIRTETSHIDGQVTLEGYKQAKEELGLEYYDYDAFLDSKTSTICEELNGKRFRIDEAEVGVNYPPMHPNCRSTTQLVLDENYKKEEKETVKVGANENKNNEAKETNKNSAQKSSDDKPVLIEKGTQKKGSEIPKEEKITYKPFDNGEAANEFFYKNKEYQKWVNSLNKDETEAIQEYTEDLYSVINDKLRGFYDTDDKLINDAINKLSNSIDNFKLTDNIQVYRGVDVNALDGFMRQNNINKYTEAIGKIYNDKAFMSTSLLKSGAGLEKFNEQDIQFIINIPKGKGRGAYINELSLKKDKEYEFLLQKNSKLRITDVKPIENTNQTIIFADLEI